MHPGARPPRPADREPGRERRPAGHTRPHAGPHRPHPVALVRAPDADAAADLPRLRREVRRYADSIAKAHGTTARSIAFWNRTSHPSLDPDSPDYEPDRIKIGWVLQLVPGTEIDEDETFPD